MGNYGQDYESIYEVDLNMSKIINRDKKKIKPKPKSKWQQDLEDKVDAEPIFDKKRPENKEIQVIKPVGDK